MNSKALLLRFHGINQWILCLVSMFSVCQSRPAAAADLDASRWLAVLASPSLMQRRAAIEAIQTLDDPAIPPACLPLLRDEGFSIRRQAARAIGSRFAQIPAKEKPAYLLALKTCAAEGPEDVTLLCQRAIGLLSARYDAPPFSLSPNGHWVLYERRRLPVIASTAPGGLHALLSPVSPHSQGEAASDLLKLEVTSEPVQELFEVAWHPGGNAVAFSPIVQRRFFHPICIWVAGSREVKVIEARFLGKLIPSRYPDWGTTTEFVGWKGSKAIVRIYNCDDQMSNTPPNDPGVRVSYDIRTRKLARVEGH